MYEEFFGLTEKPFSIQPDPSFLYWGRSHRLAYAMLEYGVLNHAGISVVTGGVGCGKTTLIHRLLDQLSDTHTVALISNIQEGRGDLLSWVLMAFGQPFVDKSHVELFAQLQSYFIGEYAKGRRVVLIIDEAQNLSMDQLEELRMLSNINAGKDQLLQLILVGQPQLKEVLNRPEMLQLAQRVGSDFHLTPLTREEVDAYLDTRLTIAGARRRIFTDKAVDLIAQASGGVPRVINILADTALVYAFSAQDLVVDEQTIASVIRDKKEFGVFGVAADESMPSSKNKGGGPDAFVRADAPRVPRRAAPAETERQAPREEPAARPSAAPAGFSEPRSAVQRRPAPGAPPPVLTEPAPAPRAAVRALDPAPPAPARTSEQFEAAQPGAAIAEAPRPAAQPAPRVLDDIQPRPAPADRRSDAVGIVVVGSRAGAEFDFSALRTGASGIYVAAKGGDARAEAARAAGATVLEIADRGLSPGRARNAGYRALKKAAPKVKYVQFVDEGFDLEPGWMDAAERFMERRPEVAAVEGRIDHGTRRGAVYGILAAGSDDPGEVRVTGPVFMVRADAFEGAGGFRGDLVANETADLCIRLRRRAAHIWRLDAVMGVRPGAPRGLMSFWSAMGRKGFEYAHGADLHGAPPDELYARERLRTLMIGGGLPLLYVITLLAALAAALVLPLWDPLVAVIGVTALFAVIFGLMTAVGAISRGAFRLSSWSAAFLDLIGQFAAFWGMMGFVTGGAKVKAAPRQAA